MDIQLDRRIATPFPPRTGVLLAYQHVAFCTISPDSVTVSLNYRTLPHLDSHPPFAVVSLSSVSFLSSVTSSPIFAQLPCHSFLFLLLLLPGSCNSYRRALRCFSASLQPVLLLKSHFFTVRTRGYLPSRGYFLPLPAVSQVAHPMAGSQQSQLGMTENLRHE